MANSDPLCAILSPTHCGGGIGPKSDFLRAQHPVPRQVRLLLSACGCVRQGNAETEKEYAGGHSRILAAIGRSDEVACSMGIPSQADTRRPGGLGWSRNARNNRAHSLAHGHLAPGADSPRRAFRNNNADPTNSMKNTAFPPNPRHTGAVQEVTGGFRLSAIARTTT